MEALYKSIHNVFLEVIQNVTLQESDIYLQLITVDAMEVTYFGVGSRGKMELYGEWLIVLH